MSAFYDILLVIQTIVVLFLIGIILIQRSDSDGFGTGTGGGNQFMTGRASANLLTRTTALLATAFIVISLVLANMSGHKGGRTIVDRVEATGETTAPLPGESTTQGFDALEQKTGPAKNAPPAAPQPQ